MLEKTTEQFLSDAERFLTDAATGMEFVTIKTSAGNAVLISEDEWNILLEAMKLVMQTAK